MTYDNLFEDTYEREAHRPIVFDPRSSASLRELSRLKKKNKAITVIDRFAGQVEEIFLLRNPSARFTKDYQPTCKKFAEHFLDGTKELWRAGKWVYYPWNNQLVHFLDETAHQELRTGRNRNLITEDEQRRFYRAKIGVLGLSVGSHAALTIALTGGAKYMKLADPDSISGSNLNRIRAPFSAVGLNKTVAVARQIYEINPYANLRLYPEGLVEKRLLEFLLKPRLDVVVEEMENLYLKLRVREIARVHRIPVIMGTDIGDGVLLDVERFDRNPSRPIFHGAARGVTARALKQMAPSQWIKLSTRIIGPENMTTRLRDSLLGVGTRICGVPQLGTAASLSGAVVAYAARAIVVGDAVRSGRYAVSPEQAVVPPTSAGKRKAEQHVSRFKKIMGM